MQPGVGGLNSYATQFMSAITNRIFGCVSLPQAMTLEALQIPWANESIKYAKTYRASYLREVKQALVSAGKWNESTPFTPLDAQRLKYFDQCVFFFQASSELDRLLKVWSDTCSEIKKGKFQIEIPDIHEEQAMRLMAAILGPSGKRARFIEMVNDCRDGHCKLAVQKDDGSWVYLGSDASEETIEYLTT